jgi:hypothetical protein
LVEEDQVASAEGYQLLHSSGFADPLQRKQDPKLRADQGSKSSSPEAIKTVQFASVHSSCFQPVLKTSKTLKNPELDNGMSSLSIAVVMSVLVWSIVACSKVSQAINESEMQDVN